MSLHPYGFDPPKPARRSCPSGTCGLRFENGRYVGPPSRPGALRRLLNRLRKEA